MFYKSTVLFFLAAFTVSLVYAADASALKVIALTCEYRNNPLGIESEHPRLSWQIQSMQRNQFQKAYRIIVSGDIENIKLNKGDMWDSEKVTTNQSLHIAYGGKKLLPAKRYYWKVQVWDKNDNPSDFSEVNFWEMGLAEMDWKAEWITAPAVFDFEKLNQHRYAMIHGGKKEDYTEPLPLLRKEFAVNKKVINARAYIAAPGFFELLLNGVKIGDDVLNPAYTNYTKTVLYNVYDVTANLQDGANAIGVMLGNGWFNSPSKEVWGLDKAPWRAAPLVKCQLEILYSDGSTETISTNETWLAAPSPITFSSLYQGEYYDAGLEIKNWALPGSNSGKWMPVRKVPGPLGKLKAMSLPPVKVMDNFKPMHVTTLANGNVVYDFGQNLAGYIKIKLIGEAGTELQFKHSEKVDSTGAADLSGIDNLLAEPLMQTDKYILKGGEEEWSPRFTYHGFRYVEISVKGKQPQIKEIVSCAVHTSFQDAGSFKSSSTLVNKIQESTRWSFKSNFVGFPTDCPQREKNGWTGDAQLACEAGLMNFLPVTAYEKWLADLRDEQQPDGSLCAIVPTPGWGYYWGNGPSWDIACIVIPWTLYEYTEDVQILRDNYQMMKRYVDYVKTKSPGFIADFGLGDWIPVKTETPAAITSTAYFYFGANTVAKTAALLGDSENSKLYNELGSKIKNAFNNKYFNAPSLTYTPATQTTLSCALYHGLVEGQYKKAVVKKLVAEITKTDNHIDCGILGARYLLHALTNNDEKQLAFTVASQKTFPGWGYWMEHGATTLYEDWQGITSRNHVMFGDISSWYYKTLGGVRPDNNAMGFNRFILKPEMLGDVTWVETSFESLYGTIKSNWKKTGNHFLYEIAIPANTTATVYLPSKDLKESGKYLSQVEGIKMIGKEDGRTVVLLGSGTYQFNAMLQ
jgi:alpha-L-rhamnosidase